jgi:hypothetical protein
MPTKIENKQVIDTIIKNLFELERDLATRLWSFIDQTEHMKLLRGFALAALSQMIRVSEPLFMYTKSRVETKLAIYRYGTNWEDLVRAVNADNVTPGDIADVIRLYGAWVEAGAPGAKDYYGKKLKADEVSSGLKGTPSLEEGFKRKEGYRAGPAGAWGAYRDRGATREGLLWKYVEKEENRLSPQIRDYIKREVQGLSGPNPGGMKFTLAEGGAPVLIDGNEQVAAGRLGKGPTAVSTVGRMERMFGLLDLKEQSEGADISGTTADQIYFLDYFAQVTGNRFDPILYLLPVATLVAPYHHSILEVALTLSFKGIVDYTVGLYDTLKPKDTKYTKEITDILLTAKNDPRNKFMLVYYKNSWMAQGSWIYEPQLPSDIERWKNVALCKTAYSRCRRFAGGWPSAKDIGNVML